MAYVKFLQYGECWYFPDQWHHWTDSTLMVSPSVHRPLMVWKRRTGAEQEENSNPILSTPTIMDFSPCGMALWMLFCRSLPTHSSVSWLLHIKGFLVNFLLDISSFQVSFIWVLCSQPNPDFIYDATTAPGRHPWPRQFRSQEGIWDLLDMWVQDIAREKSRVIKKWMSPQIVSRNRNKMEKILCDLLT